MASELLQNETIAILEGAIEQLLEKTLSTKFYPRKTLAPETHGKIMRLRSKFRKDLRKLSDHNEGFTSNTNGSGAFEEWKSGFIFASKLPSGAKVSFYKFEGARDAVLFYTPKSLEALKQIEITYNERLNELEHLLQVELVMIA